ncbi:MAG TPA: hypothetical protein VM052_02685 [Candidatus Limnocylindrales bacterium]|nr:hypothetical protein [Candidatus Limnocylindrales bacterium]
MRIGLLVLSVVCALVALFYAFNAYIQMRERGFTEPLDIPVAIVFGIAAILAFWRSRRTA